MLERASTCLESSGRQLLHASRPCLRSRRTLHSHFWHHGASDISLPIWWATPFSLESIGDMDRRKTASSIPTRPSGGGVLLDFLYPEKTLALIRHLSSFDVPASVSRAQSVTRCRTRRRQYSTLPAQATQDEITVSPEEQARSEMKILLHRSNAKVELERLLDISRAGRQELAWQLYLLIPEDDHVNNHHELRKGLLNYLAQDQNSVTAGRILDVFNQLPEASRKTSSYRAAIVAYNELRMIGPAIKLLEDVDEDRRYDMVHLGIDIILQRTVADEQWDLALRVFRTFLRHTPLTDGKDTRLAIRHSDMDTGLFLPDLWEGTRQLPQLREHLHSFLQYTREYREDIRASPERESALSYFVMAFVPQVMSSVLATPRLGDDAIWKWFTQLFEVLTRLELPTSACYESAIRQMLKVPLYQEYTNKDKRKIWLELYRQYKWLYSLEKEPTVEARPSENLVRKLIVHAGLHISMKRMKEYIQDLRDMYPGRSLRPGLLKYLLIRHADRGAEDQVIEFFDEMAKNYKEEIDLKVLSSLLHIYARRADVDQAVAQFRRISTEFGLVPDTTCWNILINAYCRADDLDGALECFNTCIEAGIIPDIETFGPLLDFCSDRGDIEAFEALFSRGKQMGVPLDSDMRARSGYVQVSFNAGDPEGAIAIAYEMLKSWKAGLLRDHPLTHTFNLLIQHYAVTGNLEASRQCYKHMIEHKIPVDSWTYASIMRVFVHVKQTNAAYKMLTRTMPRNSCKAYALHYAICMSGFLRESQIHRAMEVYERMKHRNIPETPSSQQATIQSLGMAEAKKKRGPKDHKYRVYTVESELGEMLMTNTDIAAASREPLHNKYLDTKDPRAVPQQQYALLASLYTHRSALKTVDKFLKRAKAAAPDSANYHTPITLLNVDMEAGLRSGNYSDVQDAWIMARSTADHLTKTVQQTLQSSSPAADSSSKPLPSLTDPSVREQFETAYISYNRRHILARSARLYMRSLFARKTAKALDAAHRTLHDLLTHGYALDNLTWNEYIQQLVLHGHYLRAFDLCEEYLMPRFPGWRTLNPNYYRTNAPGFQWMQVAKSDVVIKRDMTIMPRYKTLWTLAQGLEKVKLDERNGVGFDKKRGMWLREVLELGARDTMRAIESMPRVEDEVSRRGLLDFTGSEGEGDEDGGEVNRLEADGVEVNGPEGDTEEDDWPIAA